MTAVPVFPFAITRRQYADCTVTEQPIILYQPAVLMSLCETLQISLIQSFVSVH